MLKKKKSKTATFAGLDANNVPWNLSFAQRCVEGAARILDFETEHGPDENDWVSIGAGLNVALYHAATVIGQQVTLLEAERKSEHYRDYLEKRDETIAAQGNVKVVSPRQLHEIRAGS